MRGALVAAFLAAAGLASAQYSARSVRFLSQMDLPTLGASSGSGCSGYVSKSGREYAIIGLNTGFSVVEITNPTQPTFIGHVGGVNSSWHEVAVLGDYAYGVTEGSGGSLQVIDLRQVDNGVVTLAASYTANSYNRGHTVQASPSSSTVYVHGAQPAPLGILAIDVSDPANPIEAGKWTGAYVHDAQYVKMTSGPWAGKEIAFACCGSLGLIIIDVTNKAAMTEIGRIKYLSSGGYCHSGSLTPDGRYFLVNDEFDESNGIYSTATTHRIDVQDLANPKYAGAYTNGATVIDHNSMIQDNHLMLASYTAGVRVYRVGNGGGIKETGFLDTYPSGDTIHYAGNWGVFAGFRSGNIILSDMNRGLFVLDPSEAKGWGAPIVKVATGNGGVGPQAASKLRRPGGGQFPITAKDWQPALRVTFDSNETVWTGWSLDVRLWSTDGSAGTVRAYLKDHNTGLFVKVGQWSYSSAKQTFSTSGTNAAFVDANGMVEAKLLFSAGAGVTTKVAVDMVRATLR